MEALLENIYSLLPLGGTVLAVALFLMSANWLLFKHHPEMGNERKLPRQILMFILTLAGVIVVILVLPVADNTRNQLIALLGLLLSGVFGFSSTTIVSNSMAGIMLRVTRPFKTGDFIRIDGHFGRVTERGLLDTEIQTEYRELVSLPNTFLIAHPVQVTHSSGTIVSATLSLGYDIHHSRIQPLLIEAAKSAGLEDPFVQILELGNYSITYRISGLLKEVKSMLTTRSNLFEEVLDVLHDRGIEIVSPAFMNQRRLAENAKILPAKTVEKITNEEPPKAEDIAFDKAEKAEQMEKAKKTLETEIQNLREQAKNGGSQEKQSIEESIESKRARLEELASQSTEG